MRIGIDVSQLAYSHTGVSNYLSFLLESLLTIDTKNDYILFASSLRKKIDLQRFLVLNSRVSQKKYFFPLVFFDWIWNRLHIVPIEWFVGKVDVFITSDWVEPPTQHARKATILYDLIVYTCPEETATKIVATQKRKLKWVVKESELILCISQATRIDAEKILGISADRMQVIYPGLVV